MSGLFSLESWSTVWTHRESFLLGLGNTLQTAVCALALAFIIGAALGLMSTSGSKLLRIIARIYVEFVQNTPLLLQLCFLYYALAFAGVSLGVIRTGIIALGVYTGAYMGEVVRAAIESVPKGQFEAAQAQGFNYLQRMGYIILPQSIPVMLPPMVNQVVNLFKNTSCLYIVGGADLISVTYSFVTGASTGGAYAPRLYRLRPHLLRGLLPAVHAGSPLGGFPQGAQGPCEPGSQDRCQESRAEGGCLI